MEKTRNCPVCFKSYDGSTGQNGTCGEFCNTRKLEWGPEVMKVRAENVNEFWMENWRMPKSAKELKSFKPPKANDAKKWKAIGRAKKTKEFRSWMT